MITTRVKNTIRKYAMVEPGDCVLVAVSGGPDSVCLLFVLRELAREFKFSLQVAHLDHMFRGAESESEARFVDGLAKKLGIPASVERTDVPAYCRDRGLSAQEGAREVRYAFLKRIAAQVNAIRIATGHTANDQAETFLLRMIRGAGAGGLSSIPPVRENIIRPLIDVTRDEVMHYLKSNSLEYVLDPSNAKPVYTRNKIRLDLLPALEQFNPRIVEALASEAALLRDEDVALENFLQSLMPALMTLERGHVVLKRDAFNALMPALKRRMIKKAFMAAGGDETPLSSVQIDEAIAFLQTAQTGRSMNFGKGMVIEREYEKFFIRSSSAEKKYSYDLVVPGVTLIPEASVEAETTILESSHVKEAHAFPDSDQENYFWQAVFDYDKISPKLQIRNRLPGDWFCPAGMGGNRKKLQDFFVDAKVPRSRRDAVPLLVSADDIVWVAGFRTDERFKPGPDTRKFLVVRFRSPGGKTAG